MQRFRKALFLDLRARGMTTQQAGTTARGQAKWLLLQLFRPDGDMSKYHRREIDSALLEAARKRRYVQLLLTTPATHRVNQTPFMPMRCKGGWVNSTVERAHLVAKDLRAALARARYHRQHLARESR